MNSLQETESVGIEYSLYQFQICIQLANEWTEQDSLFIKLDMYMCMYVRYVLVEIL